MTDTTDNDPPDNDNLREEIEQARERQLNERGFGDAPDEATQERLIGDIMALIERRVNEGYPVEEWAAFVEGDLPRPDFLKLVYLCHADRGAFRRLLARVRLQCKTNHWTVECNIRNFDFKAVIEEERVRARAENVVRLNVRQHNQAAREAQERSGDGIEPGYYEHIHDVVRRFNRNHAVAKIGGGTVIVERDPNTGKLNFRTIKAFHEFYDNVRMPPKNPASYDTDAASIAWMKHKDRRQYDEIVYEPRLRMADTVLNLWRGFGFELAGFGGTALPDDMSTMPRPRGSWRRFRRHVLDNICHGNRAHYEYLVKRLALMVQKPGEVGQTILCLMGDEGVGKGIWGTTICKLMGEHGLHVTQPDDLTGRWSDHLRGKSYIFADESAFAGDPRVANKLKAMATESILSTEQKHIPKLFVRNCLHIDLATNDLHAVRVSAHSRRIVVLKVSDARINDWAYFRALIDELERNDSAGYRAMLWDLLTMDLSEFEVRRIPVTVALAEQRDLSADVHVKWWREVLSRGYVYESQLGLNHLFHHWQGFVSTELLFASYESFVGNARMNRHNRDTLIKWMVETFGCATGRRRTLIGEKPSAVAGGAASPEHGNRRGLVLRTLGEERAAYLGGTGQEALGEQIWASDGPLEGEETIMPTDDDDSVF